mmetsp:Transcript_20822/g.31864  ORF Transcript_20822/g.31864 Transcript_20822/m.31864 type:complete len:371 (-) Transcript_20822:1402-2514(-)
MPELPEVESQRVLVERMLVGKVIKKVIALEQGGGPRSGKFDEKVIQELDRTNFELALTNCRIVSSCRKGKQLYLELENGELENCALLLHFMMTGAILIQGEPVPMYQKSKFDISIWPPRFCKFELITQDETRMAFVDTRRFARVSFCRGTNYLHQPPLSTLAPDPLYECPQLSVFVEYFKTRTTPIKAILLDQKACISGIGNWLADDILCQAQIHPASPANAIPNKSIAMLRQALIEIVTTACAADARAHKFPKHWLFHHRWANITSGSVRTPLGRLHFDTIAGRTTAFLPSKQHKFSRVETKTKTKAKKRSCLFDVEENDFDDHHSPQQEQNSSATTARRTDDKSLLFISAPSTKRPRRTSPHFATVTP